MRRFYAVVTCPECEEQTDVVVCEHLGATDLIPEECPNCQADWPYEILEDAEVYA